MVAEDLGREPAPRERDQVRAVRDGRERRADVEARGLPRRPPALGAARASLELRGGVEQQERVVVHIRAVRAVEGVGLRALVQHALRRHRRVVVEEVPVVAVHLERHSRVRVGRVRDRHEVRVQEEVAAHLVLFASK